MVFQNDILAGSSGTSTAVHTIGQSIRFNDDDTANMTRTFGSGNQKIWTMSFWVKRGNLGSIQNIISRRTGGGSTSAYLGFNASDQFQFYDPSNGGELLTNAVYRDNSAWYNFVINYEASNSTQADRLKIYANGTRQTLTTSVSIADSNGNFNANVVHAIGKWQLTNIYYLDAYLAEIVWIDGTALDPSNFAETNSSGIWVPKDVSGLTFGTNGFHIDGRDASDLGDDESGNGNDFTTSGLASHDQVLDSPTNNFSVMNVISNYYSGSTFADGNLDVTRGGTTQAGPINNILMSTGKWYCEVYIVGTANSTYIGILGTQIVGSGATPDNLVGRGSKGWSYLNQNGNIFHNGSESSYGASLSAGDVLGIALDLDNSKLYFSKNGTFQNSGVPTSGSTGTGAVSITASSSIDLGGYFFSVGDGGNSGTARTVWNYGQEATFAGRASAGGNSDGNGIGNFKYSVPSGYLALCTKNLGS